MNLIKKALVLASLALASSLPFNGKNSLDDIICRTVQAQEQNDGSAESGFIPPPQTKAPPAPPSTISSGESYVPYPGPPAQPQARSEKKNPPTPPTIIEKITDDNQKDKFATPNDLNNLLKRMKQTIDIDYSSDMKNISEVNEDPDKNPILFKSTHYHFSFTYQQRQKLRQYLLNGGTLIINPGRGSKPAYDSAILELGKIMPEANLAPLSSDHPIFHSYYDLQRVRCHLGNSGDKLQEPKFIGLTYNCRVIAFVSQLGLDGWAEDQREIDQVYLPEDAIKLGVNLISYANTMRAWQKNTANKIEFVDKENASPSSISLTQIIYNGEWKTRHIGLPVLLQAFNAKTDIPIQFKRSEMELSNPNIFNSPILYMTGHEQFSLNEKEKIQLRVYLQKGGLLFAEACCGRKAFDNSFRQQINSIFPGNALKPIPPEDDIFTMPNNIKQVGITAALSGQNSKSMAKPRLEGIYLDNHYAVIYSPLAMQGGWELAQNPYALGYDDASSLLLGENILFQAMTK